MSEHEGLERELSKSEGYSVYHFVYAGLVKIQMNKSTLLTMEPNSSNLATTKLDCHLGFTIKFELRDFFLYGLYLL